MSEELQLRIFGDAGRPTLIYLPGLHGDWTLIRRFRCAVESRVRFVEITYPRTITWTATDHARAVKSALLQRGLDRGWVLAESFSSLIGWELVAGAAPEFRLDGLVLAGGFVRHPVPPAAGCARALCERLPLRLLRAGLFAYAALARIRDRRDPGLQASTREFLSRRTEEDRRAAAHRLRLIRGADHRSIARQATLPVYQLAGLFDFVVFWPPVRRWLRLNCLGWKGSHIVKPADHAVLVSAPKRSAKAVLEWIDPRN